MAWQGYGGSSYIYHATMGRAVCSNALSDICCGVWFNAAFGDGVIWSIEPAGSQGDFLQAALHGSTLFVECNINDNPSFSLNLGNPVLNAWCFLVVRMYGGGQGVYCNFIVPGGANGGSISSGGSLGPTQYTALTIGAQYNGNSPIGYFPGRIAELWFARGLAGSGVAVAWPYQMAWQLAYQGPFSVPYIGDKVVLHLPLLEGPTADRVYVANAIDQVANPSLFQFFGPAKIGGHPPLPAGFGRRRYLGRRAPLLAGVGGGGGPPASPLYVPNQPMLGM